MFCFLHYSLDRQSALGTEPQPSALKMINFPPVGRVLRMEKVSSPTSIPRLHEARWVGAGRPHTKESRREKLQTIKRVTQLSVEGSVR
jgi:hypothetical protein